MDKSETINELATALSAFQGEMKAVVFDAVNPFFKSKYATLSALVDNAAPLLSKHGLSVSQMCEDTGSVTTILMHKSGQFLIAKLTLLPTKNDPQGIGSAITYARRYAYASILGLVSEADDDGNVASTPAVALAKPNTVAAVKAAVAPTPAPVAPAAASSLEFKGTYVSVAVKDGKSKSTGKPYTISTYLVDTDLGMINIDVFGSAVPAVAGQGMTFFDFKKGEFRGEVQYSAKSVKADETSDVAQSPEDIAWEE